MSVFRLAGRTALLAAGFAGLLAGVAAAENWPNKPLTIIVPYPPAGLTDVVTRPMAIKLSKILGKPVIVQNVPGAGGKIGLESMLRAPHDGYTIGVAVPATMVSLPLTEKNYDIDPLRDLRPLTIAVDTYMVLLANPAAGRTLKEFVAKARANPAKVNYGTLGTGTSYHFYSVILAKELGIDAVHVSYKGETVALNDAAGGQIQFILTSAAAGRAYVEQNKLVALGVTSKQRVSALPDVATLREQGVDLVTDGWVGFVVPADIPGQVAARLEVAIREAIRDPEVSQIYTKLGYIVRASTGDEFRATVEANRRRFQDLIDKGDIKLDE